MPRVADGVVLENRAEGPGCYRLWIECPPVLEGAGPGQFVNVRTANGVAPLLRRPFSFCDIAPQEGRFSLLYQVVGPGTYELSSLGPGHGLSILGPLGQGFRPDFTRRAIFCAGGIGVAPFPALARWTAGRVDTVAVVGARTAALVLCQNDFAAAGIPVQIATEDGSAGVKGYVTEPLRALLASSTPGASVVYACGPEPMLATVADLCLEYDAIGQLSAEAVMGCGVGACLSCVFQTPDGRYIRSCVEGPVFSPSDVRF